MEILTFILAVWGAVLSTYLALREVNKDRRRLKVLLDYLPWSDGYRLVITNTGYRPITVEQVNIVVLMKGGFPVEAIPRYAFFADNDGGKIPELPITLSDGDSCTFYLSEDVNSMLGKTGNYLGLKVFDTEGNIYQKYTESEYDQKYGYRVPRRKRRGPVGRLFVQMKNRWTVWRFNRLHKQ